MFGATHLPEEDLKLMRLSAALLPPLPRQASYQSDVVALQTQHGPLRKHNARRVIAGGSSQNRRILTMIWTSASSSCVPLGPAT